MADDVVDGGGLARGMMGGDVREVVEADMPEAMGKRKVDALGRCIVLDPHGGAVDVANRIIGEGGVFDGVAHPAQDSGGIDG